jgi:hypothetical protein
MDVNTFYAVTAATCFTLVGLWWSVVKDKTEWFKDEAKKRMAGGVYASFLIPGLMSLGAQISGPSGSLWQGVFVIAGLAGLNYSSKLIQAARQATPNGKFNKYGWSVPVLYGIVLVFAIIPSLAGIFGMTGLGLEAVILCLLILCAHMLAWEFSTSA